MMQILIIEDNPADLFLMREAIRMCSEPANIHVAEDGGEGLELIEKFGMSQDLIMLDLNLPKISGIEILAQQGANEGPPILVLSNSVNPQDKERALELGAKEYVIKPLSHNAFISAVRDLVERWTHRVRKDPSS